MNEEAIIARQRTRPLYQLPIPGSWKYFLLAFAIYLPAGIATGFIGGFFEAKFLDAPTWCYFALPITVFFVPSLFEELVFRAWLLPHPDQTWITDKEKWMLRIRIAFSILAYVFWHPLYAWLMSLSSSGETPPPIPIWDPVFLLIVFMLGIATTYSYMKTKSLLTAIFLHWLTIMIWVFFLGGRNILLFAT